MPRSRLIAVVAALSLASMLAACSPDALTDQEKRQVQSLSLAALPPLPADPSNKYADDQRAAALGATIFFDSDFSGNRQVSCATCHKVDSHFQDGLPRARGVGTTDRRTMPLAGVAYSPWQFWDGRKDSLWSQALGPMEDAREHGGTRTLYAHLVADKFRDRYESIFGPLPDLSRVPANAGPRGSDTEQAAWRAIDEEKRDEINRVFSNLGKAIGAFERSIMPAETRFDRFAKAIGDGRMPEGEAAFSDLEMEGLKLFIGPANCINCHNGPRFTDDHFHNTGVPQAAGVPQDRGRAQAISQLLSDEFNCEGRYSDAQGECDELRFMIREGEELERAFKTPSLRGVASRPPYMHSGQIATLDEVVEHYATAPAAPSGHSELDSIVLTDRGKAALIAFLKTLD